MTHLHQHLSSRVDQWRAANYECGDHSSIAEILEWGKETATGNLRFLRRPQLRALETYWYLRLIEKTPHVFDLYKKILSPEENVDDLLDALGIPGEAFKAAKYKFDRLLDRIKTDDAFVKDFKLESLRETLTLAYPSYILALAMGAGKTILIGAIIATEFAMALEYPEGPFVQNALVFAPGKTIIESLRELAEVPYDKLLPPRMYKAFAASVKLTFTRDGEKDVPVIRGSSFNVVVTNTEKISIQKETIRKSDIGNLFAPDREDKARSEVWQIHAARAGKGKGQDRPQEGRDRGGDRRIHFSDDHRAPSTAGRASETEDRRLASNGGLCDDRYGVRREGVQRRALGRAGEED
jgi:hypothetical protein